MKKSNKLMSPVFEKVDHHVKAVSGKKESGLNSSLQPFLRKKREKIERLTLAFDLRRLYSPVL